MAFGAGAGASSVAARFERDVHGRALRALSGLAQRDNFGVIAAVVDVKTFADYAAGFYDHRANRWVGMGQADAAAR